MKFKHTMIIIYLLFFIFSCKEMNNSNKNDFKEKKSINNEKTSKNVTQNVVIKNDTLLYSNQKIEVYQEYVTRGEGVINITFDDKLILYNLDKSIYGTIINLGDSNYEFQLPKKIIARKIIPDFDEFCFDSEKPNISDEFITIYINKEPKIVENKNLDIGYSTWNEYLKKINFKCFNDNNNIYTVIKIIDDNTVLAKTTNIEDCGGETLKSKNKFEKNIKWRAGNVLNVEFLDCN